MFPLLLRENLYLLLKELHHLTYSIRQLRQLDNKTFSQFQETGHLILCLDNPLLCLFADLHSLDIKLATIFQFISRYLIPPYLSRTQHLLHWKRMELLTTSFLQTAQGNFSSFITLQSFSLLIITFVFLTLTLNPVDSNIHFQASGVPFQANNCFTN